MNWTGSRDEAGSEQHSNSQKIKGWERKARDEMGRMNGEHSRQREGESRGERGKGKGEAKDKKG